MSPLVVALTGGIGSGKSEVARHLRSCGVPIYDSDRETKGLYDRSSALVDEVCKALGKDVRDPIGKLDHSALAKEIFTSETALNAVEAIVHPAVLEDFMEWKDGADFSRWKGYAGLPPFVVMESAIVLSKPCFSGSYDASVYVTAPLEERVKRVAERDGASEKSVMDRVKSQSDDICKADAVIVNDSDIDTLHRRTDAAFEGLSDFLAKAFQNSR